MPFTRPKTLVWVDLETTGLEASIDTILELAAIVSDFDFNELGRLHLYGTLDEAGKERLKHAKILEYRHGKKVEKNTTLYDVNKTNGLLEKLKNNGLPTNVIDRRLADLIDKHTGGRRIAYLAGNSIHKDREFIREYLPMTDCRLHYRMLDVSAFKVWVEGAYGVHYRSPKSSNHRAMSDIRSSIDELKFYLKYFSNRSDLV